MDAVSVGEHVRRWRRVLRLSQRELGDRMGVPREIVSRIERGKHVPSLRTLQRIAEAMNVELASLLRKSPDATLESRLREHLTDALSVHPYDERPERQVERVLRGLMRVIYQHRNTTR